MYPTGGNTKKMEKSFNDLCDYIKEKFNDMNNKYNVVKVGFSPSKKKKLFASMIAFQK